VDFNRFGAVVKRSGYSQVNTSAFNSGATWTSLHWFETSAGNDYLIGTCGNKFGTWVAGAPSGSPTDSTGSLTITAGNNNLFRWVTFKDTAFGVNGVDAPIKWTGSGSGALMTAVTGTDYAKFIESWQNYVFLGYISISGTLHPTRLYWSNLNNPELWTATDFNEIGFKDGQDITGLQHMGDRLVVFKEKSIWIVFYTGDTNTPFLFQPTLSPVGAISGSSIQRTENGLIFQAQDGVYLFDGVSSNKLSEQVTTTITGFEKSRFPSGVSAYQYEKNRYWLSYTTSGGSTHNRILTYDTFNKAFSVYVGLAANAYAIVRVSGDERIYFGDYSGFVYRADNGTSDNPSGTATAINAYWKSKWFDLGDLVNQKGIPNLILYYENQAATLSFSYAYDLSTTDTATITKVVSAGSGGTFNRFDLDGRGRVMRWSVTNNVLDESFQLDGFAVPAYLEAPV
jgi:hypothetical protein